jgi:hypothetical protein
MNLPDRTVCLRLGHKRWEKRLGKKYSGEYYKFFLLVPSILPETLIVGVALVN